VNCRQARKILRSEEGKIVPLHAQEHLGGCAECRSYAVRLSRIEEGIRILALDPPPEPSIGFCERLIRRLEQRVNEPADFLEYVGRRVVFASLVLVLFLLLVMIVPPSGPLRHKTATASYWPPEQSVTAQEFLSPSETLPPTPVLVDFSSRRSASPGGQ
jgi:hypothetical protein